MWQGASSLLQSLWSSLSSGASVWIVFLLVASSLCSSSRSAFSEPHNNIYSSNLHHEALESSSFDALTRGTLLPKELQYHGTTTLALKYKESIIICVDSKASLGTYIGSRTVKKVLPIAPTIVATMAGGAADCAYWISLIAAESKLFAEKFHSTLSIGSIAKMLAGHLRDRRGQELSIGTMVAGYDFTTNSAECKLLSCFKVFVTYNLSQKFFL